MERGSWRLRRRLLLAAGPPLPKVRTWRVRHGCFPRRRWLFEIEAEGDRLSDLERCRDSALPRSDEIDRKISNPISAGHRVCVGAIPAGSSSRSNVHAGDDCRIRLRTACHFSRAQSGFDFGRSGLWLPCGLYDDQSGEGELFDGTDNGRLCACGVSHGTMACRTAK